MDCKINWTNRAWRTYKANIDYLGENMDSKRDKQFCIVGR